MTFVNLPQSLKHYSPNDLMDFGNVIYVNEEQYPNTPVPIFLNVVEKLITFNF